MTQRWVAVLGGAYRYDDAQLHAAYECGLQLARRGRHVVTGATTGVPHAASLGVKDAGGLVVGISPATSAGEHVERYGKPVAPNDFIVYSGMSIDARAALILRSVGAAIFIGGEMGTLAEFAAGWLCGCPFLGLQESRGGITADLRRIAASMSTQWGSSVVCADDAHELVERLCDAMDSQPPPAWIHREQTLGADVVACLSGVRAC